MLIDLESAMPRKVNEENIKDNKRISLK